MILVRRYQPEFTLDNGIVSNVFDGVKCLKPVIIDVLGESVCQLAPKRSHVGGEIKFNANGYSAVVIDITTLQVHGSILPFDGPFAITFFENLQHPTSTKEVIITTTVRIFDARNRAHIRARDFGDFRVPNNGVRVNDALTHGYIPSPKYKRINCEYFIIDVFIIISYKIMESSDIIIIDAKHGLTSNSSYHAYVEWYDAYDKKYMERGQYDNEQRIMKALDGCVNWTHIAKMDFKQYFESAGRQSSQQLASAMERHWSKYELVMPKLTESHQKSSFYTILTSFADGGTTHGELNAFMASLGLISY